MFVIASGCERSQPANRAQRQAGYLALPPYPHLSTYTFTKTPPLATRKACIRTNWSAPRLDKYHKAKEFFPEAWPSVCSGSSQSTFKGQTPPRLAASLRHAL